MEGLRSDQKDRQWRNEFWELAAGEEREPFLGEEDLEVRESAGREDARGFRQRAEGGTLE